MENFNNNNNRIDKFEKRRKDTKTISVLMVTGGLFIVVLIGFWIFGGSDSNVTDSSTPTVTGGNNNGSESELEDDMNDEEEEAFFERVETDSQENNVEEHEEDNSENTNTEEMSENPNYNHSDFEVEEVEGSDDIVVKAFTSNDWVPIGTEQEGPHTTQFDKESQDWFEMEEAIRFVTGLEADNMITWRIENNGPQKVIGTVTDKAQTEIYRVYLSWQDNEGWQPTLVEVLSENDKK